MHTQRPATPSAWQQSRTRRIVFTVLVILVPLWILLRNLFGLTEVALMWLPPEVLGEMLGESDPDAGADDIAAFEAERAHYMAIGVMSWAAVLSAFAQWRRPARRVGSMQLLLAIGLGATVVYGLSGTLSEWLIEEGLLLAPIVLLAVFHPRARDLLRPAGFDVPMAIAALVAAVPWAAYAVVNAVLQLGDATGDPHVEPEHWATNALMGITLAAAAAIGSSRADGTRLPAWIAVGGTLLFAVHSLAFPGAESGLGTVWAVLAIAWAAGFAVLLVRRIVLERGVPVLPADTPTTAEPAAASTADR
ncbi:hypothetical protein ARHIZOSPH14_14490 [Agromyces rhizosphaerae]|uniref:Uncharacterized protein n=1 Tax=Agromyces rhizosphaerae TaxID=88374 RepID=A0A9W6CVE8_9MICO|nr:hypothetical protein [Agromyces rhizosphaerae]GLI27207.1 hypothetical protein ARHIZOSPH14_14490 [Agromyces rhizosphaerae]